MSSKDDRNATAPPPYNREAERAVLGTVLRHNETLDDIDFLRPEDFYLFAHQKIFEGMLELRGSNTPVDAVTLSDWINRGGFTADIGGDHYFVDLWNAAGVSRSCIHYARIVRGESIRRRLIYVGEEIARDARDSVDSPEGLLDQAEAKILGISEATVEDPVAASEAYKEFLDELNRRTSPSYRDGAVLTGLRGFDEETGGFQPGELIIIGARTSVGKTAFSLNLALNAAFEMQTPVLFLTLEQSTVELASRMGGHVTGIDTKKFRTPSLLSDADVAALTDAIQAFANKPLFVYWARGCNVLRIGAVIRREIRKHGIRLVVIDYATLIRAEDPRLPRHEQIAAITFRLKELAGELKIPIILLAQLNREAAKQDAKPELWHLRDSGALEQDPDTVLLLYPPKDAEGNPRRDEHGKEYLTVIVSKQRNGVTGELDFLYDKATGRITH